MSEVSTVIECHGLCKTYQDGDLKVDVLQDINLTIKQGERLAIVGASGSGKSTLLHCLGGLELPSSGSVTVQGKDLAAFSEKQRGQCRNQYLGFVYQFHHLLPEFTALENVAMPLLIRHNKKKEAMAKAEYYLNEVGLGQRLKHKPTELSGGERQRAAIARALVTEPACVLADEPTGNLDSKTAEHVYELMLKLNQTLKTSFVVVTHDTNLAQHMQRQIQMADGYLS